MPRKQPPAPVSRERTTGREQEHVPGQPAHRKEQVAALATKSRANPRDKATRSVAWWRERLDGIENEKPDGDFQALCPVHGDTTPSLHVSPGGPGGSALVRCFAGCEYDEIVAAVDDEPTIQVRRTSEESEVLEAPRKPAKLGLYAKEKGFDLGELRDEIEAQAEVLFRFSDGTVKYRTDDGGYRWRGPGGEEKKDLAKAHPLWPEIVESMPARIWICEGETDCLTLRLLGLDAYSITAGAGVTLTAGQLIDLRKLGVREVAICGDADAPGRAFAREQADAARAAGLRVGVTELSAYYNGFLPSSPKDLNDHWLRLGRDAEAFLGFLDENTAWYEARRTLNNEEQAEIAKRKVEWVITDVLSKNEIAGLLGPPKIRKTWFALDIAAIVANGGLLFGQHLVLKKHAMPVLVVEEDGDDVKFMQRMDRIRDGREGQIYVKHKTGFSLLDEAQVDDLIAEVRELKVGLVILDPLQRIGGGDENSASDQKLVWDAILRIASLGDCAVIVIIHTGKDPNEWIYHAGRGSSRSGGEIDLAFLLLHGSENHPGDKNYVTLEMDGREVAGLEGYTEFRVNYEGMPVFEATGELVTSRPKRKGPPTKYDAVVAALTSDWQTQNDVGVAAGCTDPATLRKHLNAAEDAGLAESKGKEGTTKYWRTP